MSDDPPSERPATRRVAMITLDGVNYRYGHHKAVTCWEAVEAPPSPVEAQMLLEKVFDELEGDERHLRAGWAVVRWLGVIEEQPRWEGPGFLFSFEAPDLRCRFTFSGTDDSEWPSPS